MMNIRAEKFIPPVTQGGIGHDEPLRQPHSKIIPQKLSVQKSILPASKRLLYDGKDIKNVIQEEARHNPQLLAKIADELKKLKDQLEQKRRKPKPSALLQFVAEIEIPEMMALCEIYLGVIAEKLKVRYDRTRSGMDVEVDEEGQLILNGINITMLITQCQKHLTPPSRIYLKGVAARLYQLLGNSLNSQLYEKLQDTIKKHLMEITHLLSIPDTFQNHAAY